MFEVIQNKIQTQTTLYFCARICFQLKMMSNLCELFRASIIGCDKIHSTVGHTSDLETESICS